MVQLTIKVTKEILERSKDCQLSIAARNCAIALAVRDLWPDAYVYPGQIYVQAEDIGNAVAPFIFLPNEAQEFIRGFDSTAPQLRPFLAELEFTVDIPDAIIDRINIDEIRPSLVNHPTLRLIEQQATLPESTATEMYEVEIEGILF